MAKRIQMGLRAGVLVLMAVLLLYPAWARGGTYVALQPPVLPLAAALLVLAALAGGVRFAVAGSEERKRQIGRLLRDPFLYAGVAFLALLVLQWANAGRYQYFDPLTVRWIYSLPVWPGWPAAVARGDAREMLVWFVPMILLVWLVRCRLVPADRLRLLLNVLVGNAAVLAVVGIVQFKLNAPAVLWFLPLPDYFFSTFGYPNHAGAYFNLMYGVSAGLLVAEIGRQPPRRGVLLAYAGAAGLCLAGALLSLSRASIIFCGALTLFFGGIGLRVLWRRFLPVQRLYALTAAILLGTLAGLFLWDVGGRAVQHELGTLARPSEAGDMLMGDRVLLTRAAVNLWREYPWTGCGGWGFRYLGSAHMPPQDWAWVHAGLANVHNDYLQFLVEFGILGAGLLAGMGAGLLLALYRRARRPADGLRPLAACVLAGCLTVAAHAIIDLPFRSPAILWTWFAVAAIIGRWPAGDGKVLLELSKRPR